VTSARLRCIALLLWALACALPVSAHVTGTGLATLDVEGRELRYRLSLASADLPPEAARAIVRAADGERDSAERVAQWLRDGIRIRADAGECRSGRVRLQRSAAGDDRMVLQIDFSCPAAPAMLTLTDRLSDAFGEHWRTIVSVVGRDGAREEHALLHGSAPLQLRLAQPDAASGSASFVVLGIAHIASGIDHLLFLLALLLGVQRFWQAIAVVSVFTLAHALTFALATLGWVGLSPRVVEPAIALSIAAMAWLHVRRAGSPQARYGLTFAFGLLHGLGFASALQPLALQGWALARALFGFAVGVELGQALFVALALLGLHALRRLTPSDAWRAYGGWALVAVGLLWFVARLLPEA
jgi:hypothetical protein